jgi:hypothetical protein
MVNCQQKKKYMVNELQHLFLINHQLQHKLTIFLYLLNYNSQRFYAK